MYVCMYIYIHIYIYTIYVCVYIYIREHQDQVGMNLANLLWLLAMPQVLLGRNIALGSTPTSGRAVQQKVEGRFNHGVNFFDAFCHQDGVSLFVWTQQLHHTMTSCAQSTFTFLSATSGNALLLEFVPAMAFVEHKSLGTACSNSMPGTAGTAQPLDWTFTWNAIYAEQVWSWMHHESRSLALPACKLVLLWRTLRESIFHCLRHVLVSLIC